MNKTWLTAGLLAVALHASLLLCFWLVRPVEIMPPSANNIANINVYIVPASTLVPQQQHVEPELSQAAIKIIKTTGQTTLQTQLNNTAAHHAKAEDVGNTLSPTAIQQLLTSISGQIQQHITYPDAKAPAYPVQLQFQLLPDGKLTHINITESSGNVLFDSAASAAVQAASPVEVNSVIHLQQPITLLLPVRFN